MQIDQYGAPYLQKLTEGLDGGNANDEDCSKLTNCTAPELNESLRNRFVTGDWPKASQRGQLSEYNGEDDDDTVYGEFEDLETGEKHSSHHIAINKEDDSLNEERRLKKLALRAKFDAQYPFNESNYHKICSR